MNAATKKEKFVSALVGPKSYGERITDLQEQKEEIDYQISQTIKESYANDPALKNLTKDELWRVVRRAPHQLTIICHTECTASPYALHAHSDSNPFTCAWCRKHLGDE